MSCMDKSIDMSMWVSLAPAIRVSVNNPQNGQYKFLKFLVILQFRYSMCVNSYAQSTRMALLPSGHCPMVSMIPWVLWFSWTLSAGSIKWAASRLVTVAESLIAVGSYKVMKCLAHNCLSCSLSLSNIFYCSQIIATLYFSLLITIISWYSLSTPLLFSISQKKTREDAAA